MGRGDRGPTLTQDEIQALAGELRRIRQKARRSLASVGEEVGISHAAVSKIETGASVPTLGTLKAICRALGVRLARVAKAVDMAAD